ncbi:TPA: AIPR family protein [Pseudomonas aeruginosa]|nr:AIPR family protein [Pseudomonas aeruginosa]
MNNITLQSMLKEFSTKNSLTDRDSLRFEKFVIYSLLANDYNDTFESDALSTGNCIGIDSVAIAINDVLVYSVSSAVPLTTGTFDTSFTFIQAKTSSSVDLGDYLKFLQTIKIFFTGKLEDQPAELREAYEIKNFIYDKAGKFRCDPTLTMKYVYTGDGKFPDKDFLPQVKATTSEIESLKYMFSSVENKLIGAAELQNLYKETLNRITKPLMFQRHVALPKLSLATAAYLGVSKCKDYVEFIKNQSGNINKGVFYDNVRDYLGSTNQVNADIADTIKSDAQRNLFSVLNNGVTVVAKKVVPSGDVFKISGFQVVNGCQTSHVLFENREHITDDMYVTIKLIETDDIELSSSVIKATNSQSVVMKEAFATIKPYHKRLEDFFAAMNTQGHRFFYARRPHQYDEDDTILQSETVSAPLLIKSFISIALEEPHKVHFYYGQLLKDYNNEASNLLFSESHHPALYFVSHLIFSKSKEYCARRRISKWSYHIALLVKKLLHIDLSPEKKTTDDHVKDMITKINNGFDREIQTAEAIITSFGFGSNDHMDPRHTSAILEKYKIVIANSHRQKAGAAQERKNVGPSDTSNLMQSQAQLLKGIYRVRRYKALNGTATFSYNSKEHSYQYENPKFDSIEEVSCTIVFEGGAIHDVVF